MRYWDRIMKQWKLLNLRIFLAKVILKTNTDEQLLPKIDSIFHDISMKKRCTNVLSEKILDSWNKMPTWSIEWFFSWALLSSQSHSHTTCAHFVRWANRLHAFVLISHAKEREYEENVIEDLIGCGNEEEKHDYYEDIRRSGIIFPLPPNPNVPSVI